MTTQLDPWELHAPDEHVLSKDCWCDPVVIPVTGDDFELGSACSLDGDECEACQ